MLGLIVLAVRACSARVAGWQEEQLVEQIRRRLHDITELKRLDNLWQQYVANVSHELKTPLSSIKAYTETLLNGALEDGDHARRFLQRIDDQSDRLYELILDLLALARIASTRPVRANWMAPA